MFFPSLKKMDENVQMQVLVVVVFIPNFPKVRWKETLCLFALFSFLPSFFPLII